MSTTSSILFPIGWKGSTHSSLFTHTHVSYYFFVFFNAINTANMRDSGTMSRRPNEAPQSILLLLQNISSEEVSNKLLETGDIHFISLTSKRLPPSFHYIRTCHHMRCLHFSFHTTHCTMGRWKYTMQLSFFIPSKDLQLYHS